MRTSRIMTTALLIVGSGLALHGAKAQQAGIQRTDLVQRDLGVPGREAVQVRVDFEPGAVSIKHSHPGEEVAYVLEGSQLGGASMFKRLGPRLAPHPMRYFQPVDAPEGLPAQWKDFVAQLAAALRDPAAVDAAQRGAVAGFRTLMPRFGLAA